MAELAFDEVGLARALDQLPVPLKVAYGAAAAERWRPALERLPGPPGATAVFTTALDQLWTELGRSSTPADELRALADACVALIPDEDDITSDDQAIAEDAASAVVYAIRALASGESREAAWAGRRAYEAAENVAMHDDDESGVTLEHPAVQEELRRQQRDLRNARDGAKTGNLVEAISTLRRDAKLDAGDGSLRAT